MSANHINWGMESKTGKGSALGVLAHDGWWGYWTCLYGLKISSSTSNAACIIDKHTQKQGGRFTISVLSLDKAETVQSLIFSSWERSWWRSEHAMFSSTLGENVFSNFSDVFIQQLGKSSGLSLADPYRAVVLPEKVTLLTKTVFHVFEKERCQPPKTPQKLMQCRSFKFFLTGKMAQRVRSFAAGTWRPESKSLTPTSEAKCNNICL